MNLNEAISELQKNGYTIHKKMSDTALNRRYEIGREISHYYSDACRRYRNKTGRKFESYWWTSGWTYVEEFARAKGRKIAKEISQGVRYDEVSDELWPVVKEAMIEEAKKYIDRKIKEAG